MADRWRFTPQLPRRRDCLRPVACRWWRAGHRYRRRTRGDRTGRTDRRGGRSHEFRRRAPRRRGHARCRDDAHDAERGAAAGRPAADDRRGTRGGMAGTARSPVLAAARARRSTQKPHGGSSGSARGATRPSFRAPRKCRWSAATARTCRFCWRRCVRASPDGPSARPRCRQKRSTRSLPICVPPASGSRSGRRRSSTR